MLHVLKSSKCFTFNNYASLVLANFTIIMIINYWHDIELLVNVVSDFFFFLILDYFLMCMINFYILHSMCSVSHHVITIYS